MLRCLPLLLLLAAAAPAPLPAGRYDVTIKVTALQADGVPAFLLRMATGKSRTERKCLSPAQAAEGIAALLAPEAKANCRVVRMTAEEGRFAQELSCARKDGRTAAVTRSGTYSATGYSGRLAMSGDTAKGRFTMTGEQTARHTAAACR